MPRPQNMTDDEYRNYLGQQLRENPDLAGMTDEELAQRLELITEAQGLGVQVNRGQLDKNSLTDYLENKLKSYGVTYNSRKVAQDIAENITANGRNLTTEEYTNIFRQNKYTPEAGGVDTNVISSNEFRQDITRLINDQLKPTTFEEELKSLNDLIGSRSEAATKESDIERAIEETGTELTSATEDYLGGLRERGEEELRSSVPDYLSLANTRGTLFSGDPQDYVTSKAGEIQSDIENIQAELEQENEQFYFNSAYQFQLRKVLNSTTDYRAALDSERQNLQTRQQQSFLTKEQQLKNTFDEDIARRTAERNLRSQEAALRRGRSAQDRANRNALAGGIGSSAGAIGGALVGSAGGPAGVVVGSTVGGLAGGAAGGAVRE